MPAFSDGKHGGGSGSGSGGGQQDDSSNGNEHGGGGSDEGGNTSDGSGPASGRVLDPPDGSPRHPSPAALPGHPLDTRTDGNSPQPPERIGSPVRCRWVRISRYERSRPVS
ncbi:hypothetical protein [Kitasatospora sp. NPDC017646]|uniref:hypothetical protein n=1 Tax=Kitasatospora sp. NPDC017646 TaxID=3364024 RepID=UPI00379786D5